MTLADELRQLAREHRAKLKAEYEDKANQALSWFLAYIKNEVSKDPSISAILVDLSRFDREVISNEVRDVLIEKLKKEGFTVNFVNTRGGNNYRLLW